MKSLVFFFAVMTGVACTAWAQAPDTVLSHATCENITPRSILSVPNGAGDAMAMARIYGGGFMDATITVTLIDGNGMPVSGYPPEDIWLDVLDPGSVFSPCPGGAIAGRRKGVSSHVLAKLTRAELETFDPVFDTAAGLIYTLLRSDASISGLAARYSRLTVT